ncbi:hypothetical protein Lal_00037208 [Lupinus albus]|nr:hypothetical protein Lal_00037208 [Lupinus albus]
MAPLSPHRPAPPASLTSSSSHRCLVPVPSEGRRTHEETHSTSRLHLCRHAAGHPGRLPDFQSLRQGRGQGAGGLYLDCLGPVPAPHQDGDRTAGVLDPGGGHRPHGRRQVGGPHLRQVAGLVLHRFAGVAGAGHDHGQPAATGRWRGIAFAGCCRCGPGHQQVHGQGILQPPGAQVDCGSHGAERDPAGGGVFHVLRHCPGGAGRARQAPAGRHRRPVAHHAQDHRLRHEVCARGGVCRHGCNGGRQWPGDPEAHLPPAGADQGSLPAGLRHRQLGGGLSEAAGRAGPLWRQAQDLQLRHADGVFLQPRRFDDLLHLRYALHRAGLWHPHAHLHPDHHDAGADADLQGHRGRSARLAGGDRRHAAPVQHPGSGPLGDPGHRYLPRHGPFSHQRSGQLDCFGRGGQVGRRPAERRRSRARRSRDRTRSRSHAAYGSLIRYDSGRQRLGLPDRNPFLQGDLDGDEREIGAAHEASGKDAALGIGHHALQRMSAARSIAKTDFTEDVEDFHARPVDLHRTRPGRGGVLQMGIDEAADGTPHDGLVHAVLAAQGFHAFGQVLVGFEPGHHQLAELALFYVDVVVKGVAVMGGERHHHSMGVGCNRLKCVSSSLLTTKALRENRHRRRMSGSSPTSTVSSSRWPPCSVPSPSMKPEWQCIIRPAGVAGLFDAVVVQAPRGTAAQPPHAAALAVACQHAPQGRAHRCAWLQRDTKFLGRVGLQVQRARIAWLACMKELAHRQETGAGRARLGHAVPVDEAARPFVLADAGFQMRQQGLAIGVLAGLADDHRQPALAPLGIGHAQHRHFGDGRMRQQGFLDLARIDVGAARDIHVRGTSGDVEEAILVHMPEVAGMEPVMLEGLGIGLRIVVIAHEDSRSAHTDFTGLEGGQFLSIVVQDGDLHAGTRHAAAAYACLRMGVILEVQIGRQEGDVAGHFAQAVILHQHLAQLLQCMDLVGAIHGCAGIDDVFQRAVIVAVHGLILDQDLDDGGHGEEIVHLVFFHQLPGFLDHQPFGREQDAGRTARGIDHRMHACAVRQRCHYQRARLMREARQQVGQVVGHHEGHLAVREHARLGMAGGAGGVEEPQRIIVIDFGLAERFAAAIGHQRFVIEFARPCVGQGHHMFECGRGGFHRIDIRRETAVVQHHAGAAGLAEIGGLGRRDAEIGRHPDHAHLEGGPGTLEDLLVVARVDQHLVALLDAAPGEGVGQCIDTGIDLAPGDQAVAAIGCALRQDQSRLLRKAARHVREQAAQNAHIVGHCRAAHVEHAGIARIGDLHVARIMGRLHGRHHVHRDTGGTDRMALGLQAARGIDRQLAILGGDAFGNHARTLAVRGQAHGFVFQQFGHGEAVVRFHQREIVEAQAGCAQRFLPGQLGRFEAGRVAARQRQEIIDVDRRTELHRARHGLGHVGRADHQGGCTIGNERAVGALERTGHIRILVGDRAAEIETEILAHVGIGIDHAVLVILGRDHRQRIGLVTEAIEVALGDLAEDPGKATRNARFFLGVASLEQHLAHLRGGQLGHLLEADHQHVFRFASLDRLQARMDRRRTGGAGILQARGGFEAQLRQRVEDQRGREVLVQETGIEGTEVHRVDVFRLQPGMFNGGLGDLADQHFRIDAVELAELRMVPAGDAG